MKARKNELDVDFIGGVGPLTKDEEKRISEVIKMLYGHNLMLWSVNQKNQ